ncbi:MAG TPA: ribosome small subunit-dependent GTPase A [Candidatus Cryosericum sp.]
MLLATLGWDDYFSRQFEGLERDGLVLARIVEQHKSGFTAYGEQAEWQADVTGRYLHVLAGLVGFPSVGDWVALQPVPNEDRALIYALLRRRTQFVRKVAGSGIEEQVVASNVDVVFLVTGLDGNFNLRRIERYLTEAWSSGAQPVVLLNKADLCDDVATCIRAVESVAPGSAVHAVSAARNEGVDVVRGYLTPGRTIAFLGSSGVGKSTIINRLLGEDRQEVQSVSNAVGKGRHTTTSRSLLLHPDGGMIIDMPGMRELQLWASEGDVEQSFMDIELLAGRCRFKDCTHTTEPGCGVLAALDNGSLDEDRYRNYMKLQKEVRRFQHFQELREHCGQRRGMTHGEESKRCFLEVAHYVSRSVPGMDALPWWKNAAS